MIRIGVINGLRGLAILGVIYHHLFSQFTSPGFSSASVGQVPVLPFAFLSNGWLGVNLFFILSGFVLYLPYAREERTLKSKEAIWTFYRRRAKRLLPLFYISAVISLIFVYQAGSIQDFIRDFLMMLTVTFPFTQATFMPEYNWVLWSLGVEVWFSIVFPFLVVGVKRYGVKVVFGCVIVISLATRILGNHPGFESGNPYLNFVKDGLLGRLDDFVAGMLLCQLYVSGNIQIGRTLQFAMLVAGILLVYAGCAAWDYTVLGIISRDARPFINNLLQLGFGSIVYSSLAHAKLGRRIFSNSVLQLVGLMSFSLYVWHGIAIGKIINGIYEPVRIAAYLVVLFALSWLTYRYIEFGQVASVQQLLPQNPSITGESK